MPYWVTIIHAVPKNGVASSTTTQTTRPQLKQLQSAVGGLIERVPHFTEYLGLRGVAFCNEEGRPEMLNLPRNEEATKAWLKNLGPGPFRYEPELFGDVIFYSPDDENTESEDEDI